MKNLILALFLSVFSHAVLADYTGGHTVARIYVNQSGGVSFGTTTQAPNTCNYYNFHFSFDSSTQGGKSMLSFLLAAKMAKAKIDVWYTPSEKPGTDHTNGCTGSLATATHIGLQ